MKWARIFLMLLFSSTCFSNEILPRKILVLYDSRYEKSIVETAAHAMCEMPLNHLGLDLVYHDLINPLPDLANRPEILGILTCFPDGMNLEDPPVFLKWAEKAIDLGKKFVILRSLGFTKDREGRMTPEFLINRFFHKLGIHYRSSWKEFPFTYQVMQKNLEIVEFEHLYPELLPPFDKIEIIDPSVTSFLTVGIENEMYAQSDLVIAGPKGGYVAQYYDSTYAREGVLSGAQYWYINPFQFFRIALSLNNFPAADPTTLAGRRIFYSQVDGDAWNGVSDIEHYQQKGMLCSEVLFEEIFSRYPDLPASIGIIAADIDPNWVGSKKSQEIARKICALNHIEVASHSYSHPFSWKFFEKKEQKREELDYLHLYPYGSWQSSYLSWLKAAYYQKSGKIVVYETSLGAGYVTPRAYANYPFELYREIPGSLNYIQQFIPANKSISLFQWTGDCLPSEESIQMTNAFNLKNLNGGSVRKDNEAPSYLYVGPMGRKVGNSIQIYSSANNENTYTFEWKERFYGFQYLVETFKNTESPIRIKPINLYYHCYSGEKLASLNALLKNIAFIKAQKIIPVWPSRYVAAADGFYSLEIDKISCTEWRFLNRGGLQTIRIDNPDLVVNYADSKGIIGHKAFQNSLYIYLDATDPSPLLKMEKEKETLASYLVESSWEIMDLKRSDDSLEFNAIGWGVLQMQWKMKKPGIYLLNANDGKENYYVEQKVEKDGFFSVSLEPASNQEVKCKIVRKE